MDIKLRLYNSWSRSRELFEPLEPGAVRIYACGPTVYDYAHIGNFRFNVWVDVLRRVLEWAGYDVTLVMNITDVDDKTIAGARKAGESLQVYTQRYADAFFNDLRSLGIEPAAHYPRATEHIDDMVALIERLLERGLAYQKDGSVYFRVSVFPDYGKLSRLDPEQLRATGRVEGDAYDKEDARDFALWKAAKDGEPSWDTPLGKGRPGWHLECSAMSMKYLGNTFDIHVGGVDLMFPHHENEIAQSVGATGEPFARTWMHCDHLIVDGTKMSKSLGNQYTLRDLIDAGHDPASIRYLLASVHYRRPLNFTFDALAQAKAAVTRLRESVLRVESALDDLPQGGDVTGRPRFAEGRNAATNASEPAPGQDTPGAGEETPRPQEDPPPRGIAEVLAEATEGVASSLADDLNTSGALGNMFTLVKAANTALDEGTLRRADAEAVLAWFRDLDRIWAVLPGEGDLVERDVQVDGETLQAVGPPIDEADIELVVARMQARAGRDFARADELRERLSERGIVVEDTPKGARWHRAG